MNSIPKTIHCCWFGGKPLSEMTLKCIASWRKILPDSNEYYSLLSECDYNFLPLTFASANNVLLEAHSFGIVSIFPRIGGIEDYVSEEHNLFCKSMDMLYRMFLHIGKGRKNDELIDFAGQFEWEHIYEKLRILYEEAESEEE